MLRHTFNKIRYPEAVVLVRSGDWFETFGEDAISVSLATDKTLVCRDGVLSIGFPVDRLKWFKDKLLERGHQVAILA